MVTKIVTALSPAGVELTSCMDCDRPKCGKCDRAYGRLFVGGTRCESCGAGR